MSGFIALHREAFNHPLLKDADRFRAWFWLVANAAWKPTRHDARGRTIEVKRGQICAGREHLAKEWKWSPSAVERFLARLETEHMIERETGQGKSVITICNYDKYQDFSDETEHMSGQQIGQKSDRNRTAKEQGNKETREPIGSHIPPTPKRRAPRAGPISVEIPEWMPAEEWAAFLDMRKRKGAKPTDRAIHLLIGKLDTLRREGQPPGKVLDQSTVKNWTDIYPLKDHHNDRNRPDQRHPDEPSNPYVRASLERQAERAAGVGGQSGGWPEDG